MWAYHYSAKLLIEGLVLWDLFLLGARPGRGATMMCLTPKPTTPLARPGELLAFSNPRFHRRSTSGRRWRRSPDQAPFWARVSCPHVEREMHYGWWVRARAMKGGMNPTRKVRTALWLLERGGLNPDLDVKVDENTDAVYTLTCVNPQTNEAWQVKGDDVMKVMVEATERAGFEDLG